MTTDHDDQADTEAEQEQDEALRVADWPRWALAQRDRGGLTQRALDGLARHHPDTDNA